MQEKLTPASGPRIEPINLEQGGDLKYRAVFEVLPQIELKGVESLNVERPAAEVSTADVDAMIQNLREQRPTYTAVEREARDTDRVTVDFDGTIDGQPFEGGKGEGFPIDLGAGRMLADFEAGLRGVRAGESKDIELTFPANYRAANLAGKQAKFAITVKQVEERKLPELDDEFCKLYGVEEGGIERLRSEVQENMQRELADAMKARVKKQILDGLLAANPLELPKSMVDAQVRDLQIDAAPPHGCAGCLADSAGRKASRMPARRRVALSLLIGEIIRANNIQVDQTQVQTRFEELAAQFPDQGQALQQYRTNPQFRRQMEAAVLEDQVIDWIAQTRPGQREASRASRKS